MIFEPLEIYMRLWLERRKNPDLPEYQLADFMQYLTGFRDYENVRVHEFMAEVPHKY